MIYFLLFFLKIWANGLLIAQNTALLDSLLYQLESTEGYFQIDILNELAWQIRKSNSKEAFEFALRANKLAQSEGDKEREATSLNRLGEIERLNGNFNKAIQYFDEALTIERANNHKYGIARALSQLCTLHKIVGSYKEAIEYGTESLDILIELNKPASIARAYQRLALAYQEMGETDTAIDMLLRKLEVESKLSNPLISANTLVALGLIYYKIGSYSSALDYYFQAKEIWINEEEDLNLAHVHTNIGNVYLDLGDYGQAKKHNERSIFLKEKSKNSYATAINYNNLGIINEREGNYDIAKSYFHQSIKLKKASGVIAGIAISFYNLANTYKRLRQEDSALFYFEKAIQLKPESQTLAMETYWNLSELYFQRGKYQIANSFKTEYGKLRDSLNLIVKKTMKIKDDFEKAQYRSEVLQKDLEIEQALTSRKNLLISGLIGALVLLVVLFFFIFRNYQLRQKSIISEKNSIIKQQEIDELLKDIELNEINAMLKGQEMERKRIAQDLHDRLGSMLSMVKIHFNSVEENISAIQEQNNIQYEKAHSLLDEACEEVRKIAHDMVSGVLHKFGLLPALHSLQTSINETGQLKLSVLDFGFHQDRLEYEIEINVYRIIQELLGNVLKHAQASEMTIQLIKKENNLHVQVEDDGIGFNAENISSFGGMGLKNIGARVNSLNGELNIDSGKGSGTIVIIDIPLNL